MRRVQLVAMPALIVLAVGMLLIGEVATVVTALVIGALAGLLVWAVQRGRAN